MSSLTEIFLFLQKLSELKLQYNLTVLQSLKAQLNKIIGLCYVPMYLPTVPMYDIFVVKFFLLKIKKM